MKRFLLAVAVLCLFAVPALAVQDPAPKCATCVKCRCAGGACPVQCPPAAPKVVDTRSRWPWQGPFRWTGAVGRWGLGARPRFQAQR